MTLTRSYHAVRHHQYQERELFLCLLVRRGSHNASHLARWQGAWDRMEDFLRWDQQKNGASEQIAVHVSNCHCLLLYHFCSHHGHMVSFLVFTLSMNNSDPYNSDGPKSQNVYIFYHSPSDDVGDGWVIGVYKKTRSLRWDPWCLCGGLQKAELGELSFQEWCRHWRLQQHNLELNYPSPCLYWSFY